MLQGHPTKADGSGIPHPPQRKSSSLTAATTLKKSGSQTFLDLIKLAVILLVHIFVISERTKT
jgi:hypothetical protein